MGDDDSRLSEFDIQIAVLGCQSSSTASFLNTVLGDEFLPMANSSESCGNVSSMSNIVDSFRVIKPNGDHLSQNNSFIRTVDSIRDEIAQRDKSGGNSLCSKTIYEMTFPISLPKKKYDYDDGLTHTLRDDTALLFVNFPSVKCFQPTSPVATTFWQRFGTVDRVVAIIDPINDSDAECESLFRILRQSLRKNKNASISIMCIHQKNSRYNPEFGRKMQRLSKEVHSINDSLRTQRLSRMKTRTSPSTSANVNILSYDSDDDDDDTSRSIPSADHLVESSSSNGRDPIEILSVSLEDDKDVVIQTIQDLVGDLDQQTQLLKDQRDAALQHLDATAPFAQSLFSTFAKYRNLEEEHSLCRCVQRFWKLYEDCEEHAFTRLDIDMEPLRLAAPMEELIVVASWMKRLGLESEKDDLAAASTRLVKRQLQLILHKSSLWSFDKWYRKMNGCAWKKASRQDWGHVSPSDWNTIISSLLLTSSDCHFYESFGREKIMLERVRLLTNDHLTKSDPSYESWTERFTAVDGCPSLEHSLDGSYERGRFRPKYPVTFASTVRFDVPDKLSNKKHWGHISWKHCQLMRSFE